MTTDFPNVRHMRVFRETARTGSVSAAADLCALSQPAATQALKRLEAAIGAPLLVRSTGSFTPTPCGALYAARVETALDHLSIGARAALKGLPKARPFDHNVTAAQLRTLIAVAASGSFTVAAHNLDISQPTVHRAARGLEDVAGVPFFRATPSGVELTPSAQAFVLGAKLALSEIRQANEEIAQELGQHKSSFALGSLPLARTTIVPRATHAMISSTPGMQIRVVDGRYDELLRSLREGDLDCLIGALRDPPPADDIVQERLFDDALAIVAHPSHPLAGKPDLTIEDTLSYPWIAPPKTAPAGQYLFDTLRIHDRPETPVRVVSSSLIMLRGLLAEGPYVSIISRNQISIEEAAGFIAALEIPLSGDRRPIGLTTRASWRPTQSQAKFLDHLRAMAPNSS
ncbi:LysR family transcriptional regulator [Alisedimentitalea sp. MJ-SS2]|uniref:LysR family transcriptional regulator n=1 Tax=Aliisedimentitalea sp. MJ-SS2 TaxID=3049795 RepID=UPI0029127DCD|nr:LysR family transcriptional regulator [Alisedimentitalea sp. MJ-SS2]MDU8926742.1 LysR family transcriptional regulator [Alisedimentitalea sp. MJ-SS2]